MELSWLSCFPSQAFANASDDGGVELPVRSSGKRQAKMIKNVKFIEIKGASHGLLWTRAEEINAALLEFLAWLARSPFSELSLEMACIDQHEFALRDVRHVFGHICS